MKAIDTVGLRKEFGTLVAVNDISLALEPGQVLGLVGPNGAGKTTLLRMLATILRPTSGELRVLGLDSRRDYLEIRRRIGYLPDFFNLYDDLTIDECLAFFAEAYGVPAAEIPLRVSRTLALTDLEAKRNDFIKHLSRGMVQRMGVAALIVHDPAILLLDEPASGLDPRARIQLRDTLRCLSGEGKTIVISSHILNDLAGFCTQLAIMDRGRFVLHGDVQKVHATVVNTRRIEIGLVAGGPDAARVIKEIPGYEIISAEPQRLVIRIPERGADELAALNASLVSKGFRVTRFAEAYPRRSRTSSWPVCREGAPL